MRDAGCHFIGHVRLTDGRRGFKFAPFFGGMGVATPSAVAFARSGIYDERNGRLRLQRSSAAANKRDAIPLICPLGK
jgi:hypothetical protein